MHRLQSSYTNEGCASPVSNSPPVENDKILSVSQRGFDDMALKRLLQKLYSGRSYDDNPTSGTFSPFSLFLSLFLTYWRVSFTALLLTE